MRCLRFRRRLPSRRAVVLIIGSVGDRTGRDRALRVRRWRGVLLRRRLISRRVLLTCALTLVF